MGELFIQTIRLSSGERLPLLFDRDRGFPLFDPTVYALTQIRARNRSSATIESALRAVQVLYLALEICDIDLEARFQDGRVLTVGELDELVRLSRLTIEKLRPLAKARTFKPRFNISSLESHRLKAGKAFIEVCSNVAAHRVRCIRDYLHWLISVRLGKLNPRDEVFRLLSMADQEVISGLTARVGGVGENRNTLYKREGLEPEVVTELMRVIVPGHAENPWRSIFVQKRNFVMLHWLNGLGVRRGELLNIKISDIEFRKQEVVIARRADDPDDPRLLQPKTKTRDRILPLSDSLCRITSEYVVSERRKISGVKGHDFLFVSDKTGEPLSLSALNKCFQILRVSCPNLPSTLSPHVLRHTWNDRFSEAMDRVEVTPAIEQKMRSYQQGWSEASGTAATYTRRHIRKRANQASLEMQKKMFKEELDE